MARQSDGDEESVPQNETVSVELHNKRPAAMRSGVLEAKFISNVALSAPGVPEKKHIELQVPEGMSYRAGDVCAVLLINAPDTVHRVLRRFSPRRDADLEIHLSLEVHLGGVGSTGKSTWV